MEYKCIIVDDDEMSRNLIRHFVMKTNFLSLVEEFDNAVEAANFLKSDHVDILFLDVKMPEMTGMEFIQTLENDYQIILITSESDYAVEAFEKSVTDFLVKPAEYPRFLKAAQKAKNNIEKQSKLNEDLTELYVRSDSKLVRIPLENILYVEALADYVIIHTPEKKHIVHFTMKGIENRLPGKSFIRTHRSYIVNTNKIETLEDNSILINKKFIPIGASYKENLMERLNLL